MLPADAGVVRPRGRSPPGRTGAPRRRGGGPDHRRVVHGLHLVLPADAGVVRRGRRTSGHRLRAPRRRGGGPLGARGITNAVLCSPPTRGWSGRHQVRAPRDRVLPADAGVVQPRRLGLTLYRRAPRRRGGGPTTAAHQPSDRMCSPPTRGWSVHLREAVGRDRVLPADAGVVRTGLAPWLTWGCAPRRRGGGPVVTVLKTEGLVCSPPTRGWSVTGQTPRTLDRVLPADAGVVRSWRGEV